MTNFSFLFVVHIAIVDVMAVGESFALEAAQRMSLPASVLVRANALLDDETRRIVALQQRLEEETDRARHRQKEYESLTKQLEQRETDLEQAREQLQEQITKLRDGMTEEFVRDLKQRERDLESMLQEAKEAIFDAKASETQRTKIAEQTKQVIKSTRLDAEKILVETRAEDLATPLEPGEKVEIGKILVILEKGNLFGVNGMVSQKDKGRGRIVLSVAGMEVKVERHLLGYPHRSGPLGMKAKDLFMLAGNGGLDDSSEALKNISSKDRRMLKILQEELVDPDKMLSKQNAVKSNSKLSGLKTASNTVDLRGKTLTEAQAIAMQYFERLFDKTNGVSTSGLMTVVYFNIGIAKGSDDIKPKFRTWLKGLPLVYRAVPADSTDGGDAFTVVELNLKA